MFGPIISPLLRNIQQYGVTQDIILKLFLHEEYTPFSFGWFAPFTQYYMLYYGVEGGKIIFLEYQCY